MKNLKENHSLLNEEKKHQNDILLVSISSILTVLLGFSGISKITEVLWGINRTGYLFITLTIWISLVVVVLWLNYRRWIINK